MDSSRQNTSIHARLLVRHLCADYHALQNRRVELDRQIIALSANDPAQNTLWQELDAATAELTTVAQDLAAVPATDTAELRAKAEVLTSLLQSQAADPGSCCPEALALAASVAGDVMRLM